MLRSYLVMTAICAAVSGAAPAQAKCPPRGYDRAAFAQLKASEWRIEDDAARNAFARALVSCLSSPDPELRDGVAFEALSALLRNRLLSVETMEALRTDLTAMLEGPPGKGFARSFAALALSEIARADRIEAFLTPEARARLLQSAIAYLTTVKDYRGFGGRDGWRHGVAHGADLMLQLALNPALGRDHLTRIRDALATQIAPVGHSYVFGESERLARVIIYMASRGLFSEAEWSSWLSTIAKIDGDAFASVDGLSRRHNLTAFLSALYVNVTLGESAGDDVLKKGLEAAIRGLP